eukprot:gene19884-biopygen10068
MCGEQEDGAGVARAWCRRGTGYRLRFGMSGAGVARAWRGHSLFPQQGKQGESVPRMRQVRATHAPRKPKLRKWGGRGKARAPGACSSTHHRARVWILQRARQACFVHTATRLERDSMTENGKERPRARGNVWWELGRANEGAGTREQSCVWCALPRFPGALPLSSAATLPQSPDRSGTAGVRGQCTPCARARSSAVARPAVAVSTVSQSGGGHGTDGRNGHACLRPAVMVAALQPQGEQEGGAGVARAWRGRGAGYRLRLGMSGAGVARAWRGRGAGIPCSPRRTRGVHWDYYFLAAGKGVSTGTTTFGELGYAWACPPP